jgi:predicted PurR-regulated permease PerM
MTETSTDVTQHSRPQWWYLHLWQIRPIQDLCWLALGVLLIVVGYVFRGVFIPMLIGFAAAYVVNPFLTYAERRWHWQRSLVISLMIGLLLIACCVTSILVIPILIDEAYQLSSKSPVYFNTLLAWAEQHLDKSWIQSLRESEAASAGTGMDLLKAILKNAGDAFGIVGSVLGTATYLIASALLIPVYFCFFAWNFNPMLNHLKGWLPAKNQHTILRIAGRMDTAVGSFLRGRILITLGMMFLFSLAYRVVGVPYSLLLGCLTGMLCFVPYFAFVGGAAAVLATWVDALSGNASATWVDILVWPISAYCVVQLLEGWFITPWVQSKSMKMHALTVLVVLMVGGGVAGIYGLLLAIPIAGCLRVLAEELLIPRLEERARPSGDP